MLAPFKERINSGLEPTCNMLFFEALDLRPSSIDVFLYKLSQSWTRFQNEWSGFSKFQKYNNFLEPMLVRNRGTNPRDSVFTTGGQPSTWFPPGGLVEAQTLPKKRPTAPREAPLFFRASSSSIHACALQRLVIRARKHSFVARGNFVDLSRDSRVSMAKGTLLGCPKAPI